MPQFIKVEQTPAVCTITLNRDDKRNAFSDVMNAECMAAMDQAIAAACSAIVFRANPSATVWSSGHDLTEIHNAADLVNDSMFVLFRRIIDCPLPVICAVDGDVYAGGFVINLLADIVIATERSRFCMTINKMGLPLPIHVYQLCVGVLGLHKAKEMFFTARPISAQDACSQGLVNHVVAGPDELSARTDEVAQAIAACNPAGVAFAKSLFNTLTHGVALAPQTLQNYEEGARQLAQSPELARRIAALVSKLGTKS
jgi:methylmalonyl-CoA decarboxylase